MGADYDKQVATAPCTDDHVSNEHDVDWVQDRKMRSKLAFLALSHLSQQQQQAA